MVNDDIEDATLTPGAEISGLTLSSKVGPLLEKFANVPPPIAPVEGIMVSLEWAATVIAERADAG